MRITYVTEYDISDKDNYSGTPYWISKSLTQQCPQLQHIQVTESQKLLPPFAELKFRCRQWWTRYYKRARLDAELFVPHAKRVASVVNNMLKHQETDVIFTSNSPVAAAYLETDIPIVYWTDATYAGLVGFYPNFRFHHPDTMWDGYDVTNACLLNSRLLIFSSQWGANSAIELYGISRNKVKVVPFGANLQIQHTLSDVKAMIRARTRDRIKLLYIGKKWYRKGGDIVLGIAKALDAAGYPVELTIAGMIPDDEKLPTFVRYAGFLSKNNPADVEKLNQLYREAHFFLMPSRAEAFGIVFCEANAFGIPCIATHVGGIPEVIRDGINGKTFSLEAAVQEYCDFITNLLHDDSAYESLALSSYNEYLTRLNWQTASTTVRNLIAELIESS
jgi:glycosyltransferase involved in cell wall biosynthesis